MKVRVSSSVYYDLRSRLLAEEWDEPGANPYATIAAVPGCTGGLNSMRSFVHEGDTCPLHEGGES